MEKSRDDLSFEGAWAKQLKEEKEEPVAETQTEVKTHDAPAFRGQRDIVEKRTEIKVTTKKHPAPEKKQVEIVAEPSSKEGDDFEVGW
ncbi:MAG: hypothetical protein HOE76_07315 [Euryarchaeota archaeon]|jgi:hypothetical protein|nr:hypothetical protein [Euryarchaeota archaeon]MBT4982385.1 hypothetical protein [Euryarchaeota archaeon]MBT5185121.1 hypothetical protein [Euryarchaeota archaeon]